MEPKETAKGVAELAARYKQGQVAKMLGFSPQWISNMLNLFHLVEKFDKFNINIQKDPNDKQRESDKVYRHSVAYSTFSVKLE